MSQGIDIRSHTGQHVLLITVYGHEGDELQEPVYLPPDEQVTLHVEPEKLNNICIQAIATQNNDDEDDGA